MSCQFWPDNMFTASEWATEMWPICLLVMGAVYGCQLEIPIDLISYSPINIDLLNTCNLPINLLSTKSIDINLIQNYNYTTNLLGTIDNNINLILSVDETTNLIQNSIVPINLNQSLGASVPIGEFTLEPFFSPNMIQTIFIPTNLIQNGMISIDIRSVYNIETDLCIPHSEVCECQQN